MTAENITIEQFDKICRICLSPSNNMKRYTIGEIYKMIEECTSVQEPVYPDLPKKICFMCYCQLRNAYNFKKQYFQSLQRLRDVLLQSKKYSYVDSMTKIDEIAHRLNNTEPVSIDFKTKKRKLEQNVENVFIKDLLDDINQDTNQDPLSVCEPVVQSGNESIEEISMTEVFIKEEEPEIKNKTNFSNTELDKDSETNLESNSEKCNEENNDMISLADKTFEQLVEALPRKRVRYGGISEVMCDVCGKTFKPSYFPRHVKLHCDDKQDKVFECDICTHRFNEKYKLKLHKQYKHGNGPKKICSICGKLLSVISFPKHLKMHEKLNAANQTFKCNFCDQVYTHSKALDLHIRAKHSEKETNVSCDTNDTGERPFLCTICGESFGFHDMLMKHLKMHLSTKNKN